MPSFFKQTKPPYSCCEIYEKSVFRGLYATLEEIVTLVEKGNYGRIATLVETISVTLVEI